MFRILVALAEIAGAIVLLIPAAPRPSMLASSFS